MTIVLVIGHQHQEKKEGIQGDGFCGIMPQKKIDGTGSLQTCPVQLHVKKGGSTHIADTCCSHFL
jgi:hypothetical protein